MQNRNIVIANWKMNIGFQESQELARSFRKYWKKSNLKNSVDIVLCPPIVSLAAVVAECKGTEVSYGSQDVFWQEKGAYTGEVASSTLKELGCEYVIVGHSERRKYIGETDDIVNRKTKVALDSDLIPIVCVGENIDQRNENISDLVIMTQVIEGLKGIALKSDHKIIIAYEPIWVIGTGQAIEPSLAEHSARVIKQALIDLFPSEVVEKQTQIIYGGSVDHTNIQSFIDIPIVEGALVGTASLAPDDFIKLLETF